MLDLHEAASMTPSLHRRSLYLQQARDEGRHARLFLRTSNQRRLARGLRPVGSLRAADTGHLFTRLGEERFLAFVHLGERRAREKFEVLQPWMASHGEKALGKVLQGILNDEANHEGYSWDLLVQVAGDEQRARSLVRRAAIWDAWITWRRAGASLTYRVYYGVMLVIYSLLPLLAAIVLFKRPLRGGWRRLPEAPKR